MSHCEEKDGNKIIFLTKEDSDPEKSTIELPETEENDFNAGLIREDGSINWNCPCLGGMAVGPCGVEFREAFECFHNSMEEVKGSDCLEKFTTMQNCMKTYPDLYDEATTPGQDALDELEDNKTDDNQTSNQSPQENSEEQKEEKSTTEKSS